jgi:hypothetical protein
MGSEYVVAYIDRALIWISVCEECNEVTILDPYTGEVYKVHKKGCSNAGDED